MAVTVDRMQLGSPHPIHAVLLAGTFPLFLGVLLSDMAYAATHEVQWKNFASWLIVGALVFAGFAGLWALVRLIVANGRRGRSVLHVLLLLAAWVLGFVNALVHAKDAWASMPADLMLSIVVVVLAIGAIGVGFSTAGERGPK